MICKNSNKTLGTFLSNSIAGCVIIASFWLLGITNSRVFADNAKSTSTESSKQATNNSVANSDQTVFETIDKALSLTKKQQLLVDDSIKDNSPLKKYMPAFFLLMKKVCSLPRLNPDQFSELPKYKNFANCLANPKRNRFRPFRTTVKIWKILPLDMEKVAKRRESKKYWPVEKQIYMIQASIPKKKGEKEHRAVIIYTDKFPEQLNHKKLTYDKDSKQQAYIYRGRKFEIAGVFLRTAMQKSIDALKEEKISDVSGQQPKTMYPVIMVWQIKPTNPLNTGTISPMFLVVSVVIGVIALVGFYFFFKARMLKQNNASVMWKDYVPLRDLDDVDPDTGEKRELDEEEIEVDPKLKDAVVEYLKQKQSLEDRQATESKKNTQE